MIVRLTRRQHARLLAIIEQADARWADTALRWMTEEAISGGSHRVDVLMPAIGWLRVWETLFDHCYDARGYRSADVKTTDLNACKAIRTALNLRETHPALTNRGAIGAIPELVPAWRNVENTYSPYPLVGSPFVVLAPRHESAGRDRYTTWQPSIRVPERPLLDERNHLAFGPQ